MIKNIVFDFGGVIVTIDQKQAVRHFEEIGLKNAAECLDPYTQSGIFGDLEEGKITAETFRAELSKMVGRELSYGECEYGWRGYCKELPYKNLQTLLKLKEDGYRIILLSNTNPFMMGWADSDNFDEHGHSLSFYFDAMYRSYEVGMMKPSVEIFRHLVDSEKINPAETLFVDDGSRNIKAAETVGMKTFQPENGKDWTKNIFEYLREKQ